MIARLFGRFPSTELHPDQVVALGAAIQAGLVSRDAALQDRVMTDISPHTLGTAFAVLDAQGRLVGTQFQPIIERGTTLPASRSHLAGTVFDDQVEIQVEVLQGESRVPSENVEIGEVSVRVRPRPRGESKIEIRFTFDLDGLLEVEVHTLPERVRAAKVFNRGASQLDEAQMATRLSALAALKVHPRDQEVNRAVLARADALYVQLLGEERERLGAAIANFETLLAGQRPKEIAEATTTLSAVINALSFDR